MQYVNQEASGTLLVVGGDGPSMMGRDWLQTIQLNWSAICHVDKGKPQMLEEEKGCIEVAVPLFVPVNTCNKCKTKWLWNDLI